MFAYYLLKTTDKRAWNYFQAQFPKTPDHKISQLAQRLNETSKDSILPGECDLYLLKRAKRSKVALGNCEIANLHGIIDGANISVLKDLPTRVNVCWKRLMWQSKLGSCTLQCA
ncbi:hypothetical protein CBL_07799 [Carabus blaptoides fortunei]